MAASKTDTDAGDTKPVIVLLSLRKQPFWDESYAELVQKLTARATIQHLTDVKETEEYLASHTRTPSAIIATDEAVTKKKPNLSKKLIHYVQNGGTLILATHFPCFVQWPDLDSWFQNLWNLPWQTGSYTRDTVSLNPNRMQSRLTDGSLPKPYCMKAVFLKNVPSDAMVFEASSRSNESSVVFAPIREGWLGFVGDVNPGHETEEILIAMCGL